MIGAMSQPEMPIFTRTFDFLSWLLPVTNNFPRAHRHTFTIRLLDAAFELREQLEAANHRRGPDRLSSLQAADETLDRVRLYLRLAARWGWLSAGQYQDGIRNRSTFGWLAKGYSQGWVT